MPASLGAALQAIVVSPHERVRALRTALSVPSKHLDTGAVVQGTMTLKVRSPAPRGAGPLAGHTARPYVTSTSTPGIVTHCLVVVYVCECCIGIVFS